MSQINAYLTFDGNCREAMTFYRDCLGGTLTLQAADGTGRQAELVEGRILHASLERKSLVLLGADSSGNEAMIKGNTISLSLACDSPSELEGCFLKLSDGGTVVHPPHHFSAGMMGTLTDKFEKDWLLYWRK